MSSYLHAEVTRDVLGAAFEVHKTLGPGFLEKVYEEALASEFRRRGIAYQQQAVVPIVYKGEVVGKHKLDLVVSECVVVELKAVKAIEDVHLAIVRSYLAATGFSVALLLNFSGLSLVYKRIVC